MGEKKQISKVPQDPRLLKLFRKEAGIIVREKKILPPAPFETLVHLAENLIGKLNVSDEYTDFATVVIGNETWRTTVNATPFNRRLLLLPQCLKNNASCHGILDELGLICAGCKGCLIDDILTVAEELGYATLVAEGTTVAIGLVEEGAIDAVIGVSCMSVLQSAFEPVSEAAVPVIGIPLLYEGCKDTQVDKSWVLDEIRAFQQNKDITPLSVSLLKSKVKEFFTEKALGKLFNGTNKVEQFAKEIMLVGGQRMRPLMAALGYFAYAPVVDDKVLRSIAQIIESFHKASLVHDDIQDNDDQRYNSETLHKKYGIPVAINVGDFLIGKGYQLIAALPVPDKVISESLQMVSRSHIRLTEGQNDDIILNFGDKEFTTKRAIRVFEQKTGEAVKVALLLGAIAGRASKKEIKIVEKFSDAFGVAYQIRDDLNEFEEKNENEKMDDFPFLMALLNELPQPAKPKNIDDFRKKVEQKKLVIKAKEFLNLYTRKCYAELDKLENLKLRLSLYGIMGKLFKTFNLND